MLSAQLDLDPVVESVCLCLTGSDRFFDNYCALKSELDQGKAIERERYLF